MEINSKSEIPHMQLGMAMLSKHGNPERSLVENNFGTTSISHGDQSFLQHSYNGNVQVHNYSDLLLERFSNFLTKVISLSFDSRSLNST